MEFNAFDILQHVLNIVVLYTILRVILYNPVRKFMQQRDEKRRQEQQKLDSALADAQAAAEKNEQWLNNSMIETQMLIDEKMAYADKAAAKTISDAKQEAARIIEEAQQRIKIDQQKAQQCFVNQTAEIAVELAKQILGREISLSDNQYLIDDFFRKVG